MSMHSKAELYRCVSSGDMENVDCKDNNNGNIYTMYINIFVFFVEYLQNVSDTCRSPFQVFLFTDSIPTRHPLRRSKEDLPRTLGDLQRSLVTQPPG